MNEMIHIQKLQERVHELELKCLINQEENRKLKVQVEELKKIEKFLTFLIEEQEEEWEHG